MIALIGDIHGEFDVLPKLLAQIPAEAQIIQVGDFGFWPYLRDSYIKHRAIAGGTRPIFFIDGNHDHVVRLQAGECDWPQAHYIPRGEVLVLRGGERVLFLGGATSVDRPWRPRSFGPHAWFPEEVVTREDVERALDNVQKAGGIIDVMVSHSPPDSVIRKNFGPAGLQQFDIDPLTWRDPSAERVEQVWRSIGKPPLYCGHMHRSVTDGMVRILGISEIVLHEGNYEMAQDQPVEAGEPELREPRELPLLPPEPTPLNPEAA